MAGKRDYYEVLGVARASSKEDIKRAYRRLALQLHPDKNKSADAEERFKELSEAYAVLSDDEKRSLYDRFGHAGVEQRYSPEDIFRGVDFGDIFGDLGSLFESFFGGGPFGPRRGRGPEAGRALVVPVRLTLEEAFRGAKREIRAQRATECGACGGRGARAGTGLATCGECRGRGQVQRAQRTVFGSFLQVTTCHACEGTGERVEHPCTACRGRGRVVAEKTLEVSIPPGVDTGDRLRLAGQGEVAVRGGRAGDLFVELHVEDHARFARHGPDLLAELEVDFPTLVVGGNVPLELLDGEAIDVDVPASSRPGQRLRVRGRGMPTTRGGRGDLYLQLQLHVPTRPSKRVREILEDLRTALRDAPEGWLGFRKRKSQ